MKKKLLSVLLCTAMTASALAGCGGSGASGTEAAKTEGGEAKTEAAADKTGADKVKIRMTYWNSEDTMKAMLDYLAETLPEIEIEYQFIDNSNYDTIVDTQLSAGEGPDIICESPGSSLKHARLGYLEPLNDLGAEYSSAGTSVYSYDGNIYALPGISWFEGIYYNKALFEQAGCEVPKTWDEFEEVLAKLKAAGIQPISCGAADKWGATRLLNAYLVRIAGPNAMADADAGTAKYTDENYVKAAQKIQDWANAGYFGEGVNTVDMNTAGSMLLTGQSAIFYTGSWFTSNLNDPSQNLAGEDGIGFFNVPVVDASISDENSWSMNCGNILAFGQKNYDEATGWFIKYFVENMGDLAMEIQGSVKGYNYTVETDNASGYTQMVLDTINSAQSAFTWFEATMGNEVQNVAKDGIQTLLTGELSAEDYMKSIQEAWDMAQ